MNEIYKIKLFFLRIAKYVKTVFCNFFVYFHKVVC